MNPFKKKRDLIFNLKDISNKDKTYKCKNCGEKFKESKSREMLYICPNCGRHFTISARYRINTIMDSKSFIEICRGLKGDNLIDFPDYDEKIQSNKEKTGMREAVIAGTGTIHGHKTVICVMDSRFMMGSMGAVVGEKITRACEYATKKRLPLIIFSASGGARMQEGIFSLFQMAKTAAAIKKHSEEGLLYISVLTNPTTGGVTASFASLGDIILAEPDALIGFAGPRVIKETIGEELPEGFQKAEYLLEHGFIDACVERGKMRDTLGRILKIHEES